MKNMLQGRSNGRKKIKVFLIDCRVPSEATLEKNKPIDASPLVCV